MNGFAGTTRLVRLAVRRDRITLPAWILGMAAFLAATTALFDKQYTQHPALLVPDTRIVVENPGMRVLGMVTGAHIGGYTLHRDALILAVLAAMMSVLAVVRHTRQSEELGREEMVRAGVAGRLSSLSAAVIVALGANLVLGVLLGLGMVVAGQPVAGALAGGASIALVGVAFTGVAAVTSQLSSTARGAIGVAGGALGLAFLSAALGNMTGTVDAAALRVTSAWPAWLSPIGWGQQMRPFADNRWWPAAFAVLSCAVLFGAAVVLLGRRDVGRGVWPERRGAAHASPSLLSPAGLIWRQQRPALVGWATGLLGFGLVFGALSDQIKDLTGEATEWYATFGGDAGLLGAYWASMMQIAGMAVAGYVVALVLRLHHDEIRGTLEPVLGTAVSRLRWLGAYAVNALTGALGLLLIFAVAMALTGAGVLGGTASLMGDLVGAAFVQLPAIALLGAAVVVLIMALPRWSAGLAWTLMVFAVFAGPMFGPSLNLPAWLLDLSPFTHVPNVPAEGASAVPLVGLSLGFVLLALAGAGLLRRRDLALPA
ncbi:ABC transporter permease [Paractinoplanes brasiliensis]|uniref:ABC-2 type transport system permease protein n=1 Tax=Paractinoplanes brasiliensis TaxID=52695 RepID=A0A4R6JAY0_9ACTN|nr:ABC antibiotics transporter [Actinoplanes brasiliensis]TDO32870.1 ABC-2 type transport system permease protein [Actinoplanes brasiliensis]GID31585.1 exporter of polyketide antibiotics [Actinoplanes brasiliensis]